MKFEEINPPRLFGVGQNDEIQLKDCARIDLAPDEQVTFVTDSGSEYDVVKKAWGYYATPSLNGRLPSFGLRGVLVKSSDGKCFLMLVEGTKEGDFQHYLKSHGLNVLCWLDSDSSLADLEQKLKEI